MKRLIAYIGAVVACITISVTAAADETDLVLTSQWRQYEQAAKADRPAEMERILDEILSKAEKDRLDIDYFRASRLKIDVVVSRNWKLRDSIRSQVTASVERYDSPMVTLAWMREITRSNSSEMLEFVGKRRRELAAGRTPGLWSEIGSYLGGALADYISDDAEYALWMLMGRRSFNALNPQADDVYKALSAAIADRYPQRPALDYYVASKVSIDKGRRAKMDSLARCYSGTAAGLFPAAAVLRLQFNELEQTKASQQSYIALQGICRTFEKQRAAFTGREKDIASRIDDIQRLLKTLEGSDITLGIASDTLYIGLRNLAKVSLRLFDRAGEQQLREWTMNNAAASFYVRDTLRLALPSLDDGEYLIKATGEDAEAVTRYGRYRIALSQRQDGRGICLYAAEGLSGKPLSSAIVHLLEGEQIVGQDTLGTGGFCPLPHSMGEQIRKKTRNWRVYVTSKAADGTLMQSSPIDVSYRRYGSVSDEDPLMGCLLTDRGAYNPGDTVRYKVITWRGTLVGKRRIEPSATISVTITDPEGNECGSLTHLTGEMGSAEGSFVLPEGGRRGLFRLTLQSEGRYVASGSVRVEDAVLPTFEIQFDRDERMHLPGDTVSISGRIVRYSGHATAPSSVSAMIRRWSFIYNEEMPVEVAADGSFSLQFVPSEYGQYYIRLRVVDTGGETCEEYASCYVNRNVSLTLDIADLKRGFFYIDENEEHSDDDLPSFEGPQSRILVEDQARLTFNTERPGVRGTVQFSLSDWQGREIKRYETPLGQEYVLDMQSLPSGLYRIEVISAGDEWREKWFLRPDQQFCLLRLKPGETVLDMPLSLLVMADGETIAEDGTFDVTIGGCCGPRWWAVTLYGPDRAVYAVHNVKIDGRRGAKSSLRTISFKCLEEMPALLSVNLFSFKDYSCSQYDYTFRRETNQDVLPLKMEPLRGPLRPRSEYTVTLRTEPGAEVAVAIFDKSLDAIRPNKWHALRAALPSVDYLYSSTSAGFVTGIGGEPDDGFRYRALGGSVNGVSFYSVEESMVRKEMVNDAAATKSSASDEESAQPIILREKMETALAFYPMLRADGDGRLSFRFRTSDKLSTYYVQMFAHSKDFRNAVCCEETIVSLPILLQMEPPRYMFEGDTCRLSLTVSNSLEREASGTLFTERRLGAKILDRTESRISIDAGGHFVQDILITVPGADSRGTFAKAMTVTARFEEDEGLGDALKAEIELYPDKQKIREAYSRVLPAAADLDAAVEELRSRFVNVQSQGEPEVVSLIDLIREAVPEHVEVRGRDVLSLTESYYSMVLSSTLNPVCEPEGRGNDPSQLMRRILACRNDDGGFAWFEGLQSNRIITAVVLERMARLRNRGYDIPDLSSTVRWLDKSMVTPIEYWRCGLSVEQYGYVRSFYPEVPFEMPSDKAAKKAVKQTCKDLRAWLVPSARDGRGLEGRILAKARRLRTLQNLSQLPGGTELAKAWGINWFTRRKLANSQRADVLSLLGYAVAHRDGGWYYPNAVMPWRGLLEGEAYAHALLCEVLSTYAQSEEGVKALAKWKYSEPRPDVVADGIRLWLMLQNETQQWTSEPAFVDAIDAVLGGSDEVLETRIVTLWGEGEMPFAAVRPSGDGFTIQRRFLREKSRAYVSGNATGETGVTLAGWEEIAEGDVIRRGDKIRAEYRVWSQENRSFVCLSAPREAALRPVDQLSGPYSWYFGGYRDVQKSQTLYWFESWPEESTVISETFFAVLDGVFKAPTVAIESLYAPHWRAVAGFTDPLEVIH